MRLLAALTLFISVSLSSITNGGQPELQWEYQVNPNIFPTRLSVAFSSGQGRPKANAQGGCVVSLTLTNPQAPDDPLNYVIFTLGSDGSLEWESPILRYEPKAVLFQEGILVYRFSSLASAADPDGNSQYFYVPLSNGNLNETPLPLTVSGLLYADYLSPNPDKFFFASTSEGGAVRIQKWTIPITSPQLAGSSFGIEDGNLIISWPTTAGQTYQVQRSTDLQSWENIGVALTGNGTTMSYSQPSNAAKIFLRVVIP